MKQVLITTRKHQPGRHRRMGLVLALLLPGLVTHAQQLPPLVADSSAVQLEMPLDSLVAEPVQPTATDSVQLAWLRTPPTLRDLVGDRVGCIETDAPHQFNNSVMAYVTLFTARKRAYMQRVLERENLYFPLFEKYLTKYNLPTDLKYLAVVESSLIPTAKSPVGATGLWQFMGPTAGDLRLRRDDWVDERMAPEKATEAACKHLRYLYAIFHDWELVLAAYNWGAGNMQRVMRRTGKTNFWDMYPNMPAETRNYVPTFTAVMYSMKYAQAHGLHSDKLAYQYSEPLDTLGLRGQAFDLRRLSQACGYADSLYLVRYNPELRRAGLPAGYHPYVVHFPAAARAQMGDVDHTTLVSYCQPLTELPKPLMPRPPRLDGVEPWASSQLLAATAGPRAEAAPAAQRSRRVRHTVRRGETLAAVAEKYEVSQTQLRRWNELPKGRALKPGRALVVFIPMPAPAAPTKTEVAAVVVPKPARPLLSAEEVAARNALAAANTREAARLEALAEQEKQQELRLAQLRRRQEAAQRSAAKIAATRAASEEKAAAFAALVRQAAETQLATSQTRNASATTPAATASIVEEKETNQAVASTQEMVETTPVPVMRSRRVTPVEATDLSTADEAPTVPTTYVVRRGDNLTKLARQYNLSIAQVVAWNHLKTEVVEAGQRLRLHAPADAVAEGPRRTSKNTTSQEVASTARSQKSTVTEIKSVPKTHLVQPGDTLYNISRRFGVSIEAIRQLNHLTSDEVKLGQKLVLLQG